MSNRPAHPPRSCAAALFLPLALGLSTIPPLAHAQLADMLKGGGLPSSLSSVTSGSTGNVAGVIEFCVKNNYLNADAATAVKDKLLGSMGGSSKASSDTGYTKGAGGLLTGSDGKQMDLTGGGLKKEVTKQVCDKILAQGKSML